MTVLFVNDAPTVSGAEHVMLAHVDAIRRQGGRCHVVLRDNNTRLKQALDRRGVTWTVAPFSRAIVRTTLSPGSLVEFVRAFASTGRLIRDVARDTDADVIHAVSYPASLYVALARTPRVPVIWHEHNIKALHVVSRMLLRFVASRCALVAGPSDAVTRNLANAGVPARVLRTIYNGVDLSRFVPSEETARRARASLGLAEGQPALALVGQMLPYKGHGVLLEAVCELRDRWPSLAVYFVGALENPPYERSLRELIERFDLGAHVVFTGWRADVYDLEQAMDVIVVPTITPEPAALTLIEGMALGRPLVATRTGGTAELVLDGETGLLVPPGDARALAAALDRLLRDPPLRDLLGEAGRRRVETRFSEERHVGEMLSVYEEIRARSPRAR